MRSHRPSARCVKAKPKPVFKMIRSCRPCCVTSVRLSYRDRSNRFEPHLLRRMSMMKGQLAGLMKQAQAMQDNMKKAQDQLALIEVEGQSGAGLVKVVMTCKNDVKRVSIDPSLLADDKDMLEDLVAAAFNDAVRKAEATSQEKMSGATAGMALPPGFKMPF